MSCANIFLGELDLSTHILILGKLAVDFFIFCCEETINECRRHNKSFVAQIKFYCNCSLILFSNFTVSEDLVSNG